MKKDLHSTPKSLLQTIEYGVLEIKGSGNFISDAVQEPDNKEYLLSSLQRMMFFLDCSQSVCQHCSMFLHNLDFNFNPDVFCWKESAMALLKTYRT